MTLETPLADIPRAKRFLPKLEKLGLSTVRDLLWHIPSRYIDFSHIYQIKDLKPEVEATVRGIIQSINTRYIWRNRRMTITNAVVSDETGSIEIVWFNQPYLTQTLKQDKEINIAGIATLRNNKLLFTNPAYELITSGGTTKHTGRIVPIYPETKGLTSKGIRYLIQIIFDTLPPVAETLPETVLEAASLPDINTALHRIHFPKTQKDITAARKRFAFEELFLLQLHNLLQRMQLASQQSPIISVTESEMHNLTARLPFNLTASQQEALNDITRDIGRSQPMNRFLQGDVGSGKTIVAALAAIASATHGYQITFMVPTSILAQQHYKTLLKFFSYFEGGIGLLTNADARMYYGENSTTDTTKKKLTDAIENGTLKIIIGTHALIQKNITFSNLGLIIIDEQHRFGVNQRAALTKSGSTTPHFLSMSATPIPRTLSLTIFGDLDISLITELPKNRKPVTTKVVDPNKRQAAYIFIKQQVRDGRQVFVVCPRITAPEHSDTDTLDARKRTWLEVRNVEEEYEKLSRTIFPNLRIAMLHGKLNAEEKNEIMKQFTQGNIDILVSTSVIEVGIDVPNATIMMIEGAERFGLAQLYQFRGRVGRGEHQSYCLLFTDTHTPATHARLASVARAKNGFELAEEDLKLRGPGEFLGSSQTGMPDIAMQALQNPEFIKDARNAAQVIVHKDRTLTIYPKLKERLERFTQRVHGE